MTQCLLKDQHELITFYGFPAKRWQSIRTVNLIELAFTTIRHWAKRYKDRLSPDTTLHIMFKLGLCAEKRWLKFRIFSIWLGSSPKSNSLTEVKCKRFTRTPLNLTGWTPPLAIAQFRLQSGGWEACVNGIPYA